MKRNLNDNRFCSLTTWISIALWMPCLMLGVSAFGQNASPPDKTGAEVRQAARTYRLVYTLTEMEGAKRLGVQHFSMTTNPNSGSSEIKVGSRVPIVTGSYKDNAATSGVQTQFTYVDVGLTIHARVDELANGIQVHTEVNQSSVADSNEATTHQPVIRNANLQNSAVLTAGKSIVLGSLDVPGSVRHLDIEMNMEIVR